MIASLSGYAHEKPKDRVKTGMTLVFKELGSQPNIVELLEDRLRNPMAHMGITKDHVILIDLYDQPIVWGKFHNTDAIVINSRLWAKHICEHFEGFASDLQDPNPIFNNLRQHFLDRIKNPA